MENRNALLEGELPHLRRYARALARDVDAANDLVQDTVMRALRKWESWNETAPLRHWLFTIMRNRHIELSRRINRWRAISAEGADVSEIAAPQRVDPMILHSVAGAMKALSDDQREILFLVAVEGLSYAEAAAVTGAAPGTVMSRLSRARAILRAETGGM